jgi:hypothetical protein
LPTEKFILSTLLIFWSPPPPTSSLQTLSVVSPTGKSHGPVGIWNRKKLQKINKIEVINFSVGNTYCQYYEENFHFSVSQYFSKLNSQRAVAIANWVTAEVHLIHLLHVYSICTVNFWLYP